MPPRLPCGRSSFLAALAALCTVAHAQDQANDLRPLPDDRNPVAIAASPFHIWIATRTSLSRWSRIGDDAPVWYGPGHDLPGEGIKSACWDVPSSQLRLLGADGISYVWSESTNRATASSATLSCSSNISRQLSSSDLPNLIPETPGWMYQAGALLEPGGRHATIRLALLVENRDLWLATSNAGIWKGRWPSGRVVSLSSGLGETCIKRATRESDGTVWLLGCGGNIARLAADGGMQSIDPRSPRWTDLRRAIDLAPAQEGGAWVAVPSGVVRVTPQGIAERFLGRKAPFGGTPVALASLADTVWCLSEHGLAASIDGAAFEPIPLGDSATGFRALCIAPTRQGLLAGTPNGFRLWNGSDWIRPPALAHAKNRIVYKIAVEPRNDRIAWFDGSFLRVDTLRGAHGGIGVWTPPSDDLSDFAWDRDGRLQIAHTSWTLWKPDDGLGKTWTLPVNAEIVLPGSPWTFVGGTTGGIEARTSAWAP